MEKWRGKWALVTGASAGIGAEIARQLAASGANLILTARRAERLSQLAKELAGRHQVQTEVCAADLTKPQAPGELFRFTQDKALLVEVLINNAGFGAYGEFHKVDAQRLLDMVAVNVGAVVHLTHLFLAPMIERRSGYIMIVASTAAFQPVPYISTYAATKGFDLLLAEGLAEEARPYGVHVCGLCPGSTVSEFHRVAGQPERTAGRQQATEEVARIGLEALAAGKPRVIAGTRNWLSVEAQRLAPRRLVTRVAASMFRPRGQATDTK
jgi:short-subunit dehydrogenase